MGKVITDQFGDWSKGVVTSTEASKLPKNASPRGYNSNLVNIGNSAIPTKRDGFTTMNTTALSANPIIGQFEYRRRSSDTIYAYHICVSNNGQVDWLNTSGVATSIGGAASLTAGDYFPSFCEANNICYLANGQETKKISYVSAALALQGVGITAPTVGTMAGAAGAAGSHNGTYELRVTYANTNTGYESSVSATASATVTVSSQQINWTNIPLSADTQVTTRYLYVRNTDTMSRFYRAGTIANNTSTTATTNVADSALTTVAPDTDENNTPTSGIKYLAWHKSRLFGATNNYLYYSGEGKPEAWDPEGYELINPDDGQKITGLCVANDLLYIFKENSVYCLDGNDPDEWIIKLVVPDIGCVSFRSIVVSEGKLYWWSDSGPVVWDGLGAVVPIGLGFIESDVRAINEVYPQYICGAVSTVDQLILWALPATSQTRNTFILPYSYRLNCWVSNYWDPIDACSLATVNDATGIVRVMLGSYAGQVFKYGTANNDGVPSGTTSATFTQSGTSLSSVAGTGFYNTGSKLVERYITLVDSNGHYVDRRRISSNTSTALTLALAITGLTNGATYTAYIGGPRFEWDTTWSDMSYSSISGSYNGGISKKRFEFITVETDSDVTGITYYIALAFNRDSSFGQVKTVTTTANSATWNASIWTSSSYGTRQTEVIRLRVGRTGINYKLRFWNYLPDNDFKIINIATRAEALGEKLG